MSPEDIRDQQIENYIHNKMDANERLRFETMLGQDSVLKKEVEELLTIKNLYNKPLLDFKSQLDEVEQQLEKEFFFNQQAKKNKSKIRYLLPRITIAASLLLLVSLTYFYYSSTNWQKLAINATRTDFGNTRSANTSQDSPPFDNNYENYIKWSGTALKNNINKQKRDSINLNVIRGYIILERAGSAVIFYNSLQPGEKNKCELKYAIALAFVYLEQISQAKESFMYVSRECGLYSQEASDWLQKLK